MRGFSGGRRKAGGKEAIFSRYKALRCVGKFNGFFARERETRSPRRSAQVAYRNRSMNAACVSAQLVLVDIGTH
jgi:hypothetical protein